MSVLDGVRVLLIFGALWWMYGGYVWLSNARTPVRTPERLLMLVGMAGYLVVGLAIPHAFGRDGVALGVGYLIVVVIHGWLYQRVNRNIARVAPFNLAAALLIIGAGIVQGWAAYVLWAAALAVEQASPLFAGVRGRFTIQPSHFTERHGALVIVVFGESVVDIGIGAEGRAVTLSLALSAVLGLALAAALWWAYFGVGDDERAEAAMLAADPAARPALALAAYFFAYIPMLLGVVALASGVKQAIVNTGTTLPAGPCVALAVRRRAVPGRQRRVQARAQLATGGRPPWHPPQDRRRAVPADRGGGVPGRLGGRRDVQRGGRDGRADPHRGRGSDARTEGGGAGGRPPGHALAGGSGGVVPRASTVAWRHDRAVHAARDGAGLERGPQVRAVGAGGDPRP